MLIRVAEETPGTIRPLDEVREQIREQLFQEQVAEEMEQWVQTQPRQASVRVLLSEPSP